jgi:hypothetical protein
MKMTRTIEDRNKALLVLEAFEALFNMRDFVTAEKSGRRTTFNTALIFHLGATASSVWSRAPQPR